MDNNHKEYQILIVDDDGNYRKSLKRMLRYRHDDVKFVTSEAGDGMSALLKLAEERYDCILLDYKMPEQSGLELLSEINKLRNDLAIVMVTGEGNEAVAVEAMKDGAQDYLVKGWITPLILRRSIVNAVEMRHMSILLEQQQQQLIEAECYKATINSLKVACHYLGQPGTSLLGYIDLIKQQEIPEDLDEYIEGVKESALSIKEAITKMQHICMSTEKDSQTELDSWKNY